ncbi:MAG: Na+/H+ antiporter subunit D [Pseudomonadota bacterium]
MSWLLVAPILIPLLTGIAVFVAPVTVRMRGLISVAGTAALTVTGALLLVDVWQRGPIAAQMGNWTAPFGITLVADLLSAVMVLITGVMGLAVAIYALADVDRRRVSHGYHALFQMLLAGVCGAFVTGDLFNLYVWFEVMLIASFALLVLGSRRSQIDGAVKYVALNLVSTVLLLTAIGLLYGLTGTLNMADLHQRVPAVENQTLLSALAVMFLIAFGIKSAAFPLFFWLPAAYHTPPVAVSAIFAGLLTKVGVYALIRTFTLIFTHDVDFTHDILLVAAALTMLTGVLGAAAQSEFRRILSFHIVSQIGYMILGLALYTPLALAGAVFYVVHHIIVKANLFLVSGVARRVGGSFELARLGGLYKSKPLLAFLFLIPAFSLAGFPPLSGFWAKFLLVKASLDVEAYLIAAIALLTGLLTVYSMTKIWSEVFWKSPSGARADQALPPQPLALMLPIGGLATLTLMIGLAPMPLMQLAERSAEQLLNPTGYVAAVMGPLGAVP